MISFLRKGSENNEKKKKKRLLEPAGQVRRLKILYESLATVVSISREKKHILCSTKTTSLQEAWAHSKSQQSKTSLINAVFLCLSKNHHHKMIILAFYIRNGTYICTYIAQHTGVNNVTYFLDKDSERL